MLPPVVMCVTSAPRLVQASIQGNELAIDGASATSPGERTGTYGWCIAAHDTHAVAQNQLGGLEI